YGVARWGGRNAVGIAADADAIHDGQRARIERCDESTEIGHVDPGPRGVRVQLDGEAADGRAGTSDLQGGEVEPLYRARVGLAHKRGEVCGNGRAERTAGERDRGHD